MTTSVLHNRAYPFWTLQAAGWGAYALAKPLMAMLSGAPNDAPMARQLLFVGCGFLISLLMHRVYRRFWKRSLAFPSVAGVAFATSLAGGILWFVACHVLIVRTGLVLGEDWQFQVEFLLSMTVTLLGWSTFYFGIKYWQNLRDQQEMTFRANALAERARLQMLRYQINPHFLFNALNSVHALIDRDSKRAGMMIEELSDFLRYTLSDDGRAQVPLEQEFSTTSKYLEIEKIRFGSKLNVEIDLHPEVAGTLVPVFLLHPLVENAVRYGMRTTRPPVTVQLHAGSRDRTTHIRVSNTGHWVEGNTTAPSGCNGVGLRNIRQRLEQTYNGESRLEVSNLDGWVHVDMYLPRRHAGTA